MAQAEGRTSGEIVPYIVPQSGAYDVAVWRGASLSAILALCVVMLILQLYQGWSLSWLYASWSVTVLVLAAGSSPALGEDAHTPAWTYRVKIEPDLSRARIRIRFRNFRPRRLVLARPDVLAVVRVERGGTRAADGVWPMVGWETLTYQVDLRALARITAAEKQLLEEADARSWARDSLLKSAKRRVR